MRTGHQHRAINSRRAGPPHSKTLAAMKVYDIRDPQDRIFAFEIENLGVGRRGVCRIVERIPGAKVTRRPKFLSWFREAEFCEFTVDGESFAAEEPWGDNSRYWIGPKPPRWVAQAEKVRDAFANI